MSIIQCFYSAYLLLHTSLAPMCYIICGTNRFVVVVVVAWDTYDEPLLLWSQLLARWLPLGFQFEDQLFEPSVCRHVVFLGPIFTKLTKFVYLFIYCLHKVFIHLRHVWPLITHTTQNEMEHLLKSITSRGFCYVTRTLLFSIRS